MTAAAHPVNVDRLIPTAPSPEHRNVAAKARPTRARRLVVRALASAAIVTGLIGVLHHPAAAPLLRAISPASICPLTRGTPLQIDRAHAMGAAAIRNGATGTAPTRPALGFELDRSTKADIDAWAKANRVRCSSINGNDNLQRCVDVPASAAGQSMRFGPLEEISFEFRSSGVLVNVQTLRRHLAPERAAEMSKSMEEALAASLGAPSTVGGEATTSHLSHGTLNAYVATHDFTDYRATVSATKLANTGVMVREQYVSTRL